MASLCVRVAASAADLEAIARVERSFTTDRIYNVETLDGAGWRLRELTLAAPLRKTFPPPELAPGDPLFVCLLGGAIVGFGALDFERWNGRARLEHLYVAPPCRGRGVGRALVEALDRRARREADMRCLWLETQNVNVPAIAFYRRLGFRLCGLDETLYRSPSGAMEEVALFFARDLA